MFEETNENILCGAICENGEFSPVYCNPSSGECYFPDPVMSYNRLISELSVDEPAEVKFEDVVHAITCGEYGECCGVIYDGETIVKLLSDDTAVRVPADAPDAQSDDTFCIDIYADYEEED